MVINRFLRDESYLSHEKTNCLKGLSALFILLHHLYQYSNLFRDSILGMILQNMGEWFVSVFFFLSGYGLMVQYLKKGNEYVKKLPRNRILPLYIICIVMIFIYCILYFITKNEISIELLIKSFTFGGTIIKNGWYLQTILIMYIFFYLTFRFCKSEKLKWISMFTCGIIYCLCCSKLKLSTTWYTSSMVFLIGIMWAFKKEDIHRFLDNKKRYIMYFIVSFLAFGLFWVLWYKPIFPFALTVIFKMISNILFILVLLNIIMTVDIRNKVLKKIGDISFEIYTSQGVFLLLYHSEMIYIHNPWLYVLFTFVSTIIFAYILHPIFSIINKFCKGENKK